VIGAFNLRVKSPFTEVWLYEGCILPKSMENPLSRLPKEDAEPITALDTSSHSPVEGEAALSRLIQLANPVLAGEAKLFPQPLSIKAIELPFRDESSHNLATEFYQLLKTHILDRFLAMSRHSHPKTKKRKPTIRAG